MCVYVYGCAIRVAPTVVQLQWKVDGVFVCIYMFGRTLRRPCSLATLNRKKFATNSRQDTTRPCALVFLRPTQIQWCFRTPTLSKLREQRPSMRQKVLVGFHFQGQLSKPWVSVSDVNFVYNEHVLICVHCAFCSFCWVCTSTGMCVCV